MGEEAHFTVSHSIFTARPRDAILQERSFKGAPLRELLRARKANADGLPAGCTDISNSPPGSTIRILDENVAD